MNNTYKKHIETIEKFAPQIMKLEAELDSLRNNKEWKSALVYFGKMKFDKKIMEAPNRRNGYKIKNF